MVARVKKNDVVKIISGKDKGKKGSVIALHPEKDLVMVNDVAVVARHTKPRKQGETGGIKKQESFIPMSKVMPVCTSCKEATRIQAKEMESGKRVRACSRCKATF